MEILIGETNLNDRIKERINGHKANREFLKLAAINVDLARELKLNKGLTYNCKDRSLFNMRLPNGENVFNKCCTYKHQEAITLLVTHYVVLKNNLLEPTSLHTIVEKVNTAYKPLTENLRSRSIRTCLKAGYSRKIFEYDDQSDIIKPKYLPTEIEL